MKQFFVVLSLMAFMTMTSCQIQVGDKEWSMGNSYKNDTPTQVNQLGQVTTMNPFNELDVPGPFNVIYEQGENYTVRIEGTMEQLEKMTVYVKNSKLFIDRRNSKNNNFQGLQVFVTSPDIKEVDIAGSGRVTAPNALKTNKITLDVSGSGQITLAQLDCTELATDIAGSGSVVIGPVRANTVKNDIAGSGKIEIAALVCKRVENDIAGSGKVTLNNMNVDMVDSDIAGSGKVILNGTVGTHTEDIAGSGKVDVSGLK